MNSLTYLSRQFDALASSSNTATREPPIRPPDPTPWSLRSLVAPPTPRRSTAKMPSLRSLPSIRAKPQSTSPSVFLLRLLALLWYALCAAVTSLRVDDIWHDGPRTIPHRPPRRKPIEMGSETATVLDPSPQDPTYCLPPQSFAAPMLTPPPSRTPTPTYSISAALPIAPRKSPLYLPKTLVLDLDETLIHSTTRPPTTSGIRGLFGARRAAPHTVDVVMGGRPNVYYVYKRPFVDLFLRKVRF